MTSGSTSSQCTSIGRAAYGHLVAQASRGLRPDPQLGWMCPLPV